MVSRKCCSREIRTPVMKLSRYDGASRKFYYESRSIYDIEFIVACQRNECKWTHTFKHTILFRVIKKHLNYHYTKSDFELNQLLIIAIQESERDKAPNETRYDGASRKFYYESRSIL
ncbi:PREDICTED: uncharacterized protein LOC105456380 [Wasmannia auropunctata]|uniref:uncharacterized protein LOC105456380 n=1 Tax=Wasmannia auropunctata TaxID=64793 RepID=UPI0005EF77A1|nr:PREDICTED: uncharacterized protein LOC105456380 [Wasmannia auropunctata]